MNQRIIFTRITHHATITSISLLLFIYTPLIAPPKRCHSQELIPHDQPFVAAHKHHCNETTTKQSLLLLLLDNAPEDFRHKHAAKLLHAIDLFHGIPGFCATLKKTVNQARQSPYAHGYLYELETALVLQEEQHDPVCYFGREHIASEPYHKHEIDIETQRYHIECKDIYWNSKRLLTEPEKLKRQLLEENALIEEENRTLFPPKLFLLYSKQPIPENWQHWLEENNIAYDCPDASSDTDRSTDKSDESSHPD